MSVMRTSALASVRAAVSPAKPPPMMTTWGRGSVACMLVTRVLVFGSAFT